jgi:hypothetical protein
MKWILDDIFTIESDRYSFSLNKKEMTDEINPKTGKPIAHRNMWWYPTIGDCLKKYVEESVKYANDIDEVMHILQELYVMIDNLHLPTLAKIKFETLSPESGI